VRRGLGLFYSLLSVLPVLGVILGTLFSSQSVTLVGVTVGIICVWIVSRIAGFQGFGRMGSTIDLLKENDSAGGRGREARRTATFLFVAVWPWVAYAVVSVQGLMYLQILFALIWLVEFVAYRMFSLRRNKSPIVSHGIDDWLVVFCIPIGALISAIQIVPGLPPFYGFMLVSPFLLLAGIKSLYEAPKELVAGLGESG
ncbi:MAG TPA: hypothetical protein VEC08_02580, partial [Nitrososphaerales archaeon]|nr:hypothetical protein [Nitrososphaerales archaeon]